MEFDLREIHYQNVLKKSSLVITESKKLSEMVSKYYNIDKERIINLPLSINFMLESKKPNNENNVLELPNFFFFYPAQFWPHKNHITLLKAFKLVIEENKNWFLLFCGQDTGNLEFIKDYAKFLKIEKNLIIKDYINDSEIHQAYNKCSSVIMPTFFGPTNIPPLEAWYFKKPLIYSEHLKENIEKCAIFVDPLSKESIADAMNKIVNSDEEVNKIISYGTDKLLEIEKEREINLLKINSKIDKIKKISELFP